MSEFPRTAREVAELINKRVCDGDLRQFDVNTIEIIILRLIESRRKQRADLEKRKNGNC